MAVVYPIRVIDVEQTTNSSNGSIIFHRPTSWDFHTISHTWSKGVQSWSDRIGSSLLRSSAADDEEGADPSSISSYEELFRREDFSGHSCYAPFMEFLLLLKADGVRYVWLDALCINQASESGEKSQELRNMGNYYAKSAGCYVCVHGFGEGFQTWKNIHGEPAMAGVSADDENKALLLPRWFNRVWTFQEVLLPRRVFFIFHLSQLLKKTINLLIAALLHEGANGPCKCVISGGLPLPSPTSPVTYFREPKFITENLILPDLDCDPCEIGERVEIMGACNTNSVPCLRCGGYALICKPSDERLRALGLMAPAISDLYFIDRECIVDVLVMAREKHSALMYPSSQSPQPTSDTDKTLEDEEWKLIRLKTIMEQVKRNSVEMENSIASAPGINCVCEPVQVVLETARRDCTRPEDRILAILGLLGIEGVLQLRAGKSLEEQMLDMAQQLIRCGNGRVLVKLCMAQFVGNPAEGMSWAPTLQKGLRATGEQLAKQQHLSWREKRRLKRVLELQNDVETGSERAVAEQGYVMKYFIEEMVVDSVQDNGSLCFSQAKVLWDCLFIRDQAAEYQDRFHLQVFDDGRHGIRTVVQQYAFNAYFSAVACLLHRVAFVGAGHEDGDSILTHQSIVRLQGQDLESRLKQFRVHLVWLGRVTLPGGRAVHEVSMVCVGSSRAGALHKVGIAWLIPSLQSLFNSLPYFSCNIGGFQDYMDRFVMPPAFTHSSF